MNTSKQLACRQLPYRIMWTFSRSKINWFNKARLSRLSHYEVFCGFRIHLCHSIRRSGFTMRKGKCSMWVWWWYHGESSENAFVFQGLETVEVECEAGKEFKYQCKMCNCEDDGKSATCAKWIKCCKKGEFWSTNSCNMCYCDEDYRRICKAVACNFRKFWLKVWVW